MGKFIKLLSKIPSSILIILRLVFCILVFSLSIYLLALSDLFFDPGFHKVLISLALFFLPIFGAFKLIAWNRKHIEQSIKNENSSLVANTDIPELCIDMLEAVLKKYRYINFEHKLATYSDWMEFQAKNERSRMMSGVIADELQLKKLDQMAKNYILGNLASESLKELKEYNSDNSFIVTFDNVPIARNKFLNWLFNTNRIVVNFFWSGSAIEINLLSQFQFNFIDFNFNHFQIRIKITTKDMEKRGKHELTELRFALDDEDKPKYEEMVMMHMPLFSYSEKEMETSDTVEIIKFMQKFIRNTRKLIRHV